MGLALLRLWNAIETALIATMAGAALLLGTYQIASRYLTPDSRFPGTEEMTVYLVVWAMFLSCSQLVARDGHVRPDLVLRVLPVPARRIVEMINCLIAIAFSAGLAWYGARIVGEAYAFDDRSSGIFLLSDVDLRSRCSGRRRPDGTALRHPICRIRLAVRSATLGARAGRARIVPWE